MPTEVNTNNSTSLSEDVFWKSRSFARSSCFYSLAMFMIFVVSLDAAFITSLSSTPVSDTSDTFVYWFFDPRHVLQSRRTQLKLLLLFSIFLTGLRGLRGPFPSIPCDHNLLPEYSRAAPGVVQSADCGVFSYWQFALPVSIVSAIR